MGLGTSLASAAHVLGERADLRWHWQWSLEPWVVLCLVVSTGMYSIGVTRLWTQARFAHGVGLRQIGCFYLGSLALVLALLSPLDPLGSHLFSAHMVQHEVLMIAAAPMLVLGRPLAIWAWAMPFEMRRSAGRFFHHPAWRAPWRLITGLTSAWVLHALALWLWHIPSLFDAALKNNAVHALQHASFLGTALVFWWSVLGTATRRRSAAAWCPYF